MTRTNQKSTKRIKKSHKTNLKIPKSNLSKITLLTLFLTFQTISGNSVTSFFLNLLTDSVLKASIDKPLEGEIRRRVDFFDHTSNTNHTGGITLVPRSKNSDENTKRPEVYALNLFSYKKYRFGSPGISASYQLDSSNFKEGEYEQKREITYSQFTHLAFRSDFDITAKISTLFIEDDVDPAGYIRNLRIVSLNSSYPLDLEVIKIHDTPKSYLLRLVFYCFNLFLMVIACKLTFKDCTSSPNLERIPYNCSLVQGMVNLAAVRNLIFYRFVGVFWIWVLWFSFPTLSLAYLVLTQRGDPKHQKSYFIVLGVGVALSLLSLAFDFIFPYLTLYSTAALVFDLMTEFRLNNSKHHSQLFMSVLSQIYAMFVFFNEANQKYYEVSSLERIFFVTLVLGVNSAAIYIKSTKKIEVKKEKKRATLVVKKSAFDIEDETFKVEIWPYDHEGASFSDHATKGLFGSKGDQSSAKNVLDADDFAFGLDHDLEGGKGGGMRLKRAKTGFGMEEADRKGRDPAEKVDTLLSYEESDEEKDREFEFGNPLGYDRVELKGTREVEIKPSLNKI